MISARIKSSRYENIIVDCPVCNHEALLNRISDLDTLKLISGLCVSCPICNGEFWLNGDRVNERHEAIIFDCHDLLKDKRYMNCVLNVSQAYEMFFSLYLRVNLLYIPFGNKSHSIENTENKFNRSYTELNNKIERFAFKKMRNIFLHLLIASDRPSNIDEASDYIQNLHNYKELPEDTKLKMYTDKNVADLLLRIKRTKINELRNRVIHKEAFRPTRVQAEDAVKEARAVLFPLTYQLNLRDDLNWYLVI